MQLSDITTDQLEAFKNNEDNLFAHWPAIMQQIAKAIGRSHFLWKNSLDHQFKSATCNTFASNVYYVLKADYQLPSGEESAGLPEIDRRNYPPKPAETTRQLLRVDINPDENKFIGRLLVGIGQPSETSLHVYVDTETLSRMTAKDQHFLLWCLDGARNQVRQTIADSPQ